jgi:hypothetical protein
VIASEAWPRCPICGHAVNPRSEVCVELHGLCTSTGCQVQWPVVPAWRRREPAVYRHAAAAGVGAGTTFLVDLASYQEGIDLTKVKAAGYTAVNIKLTQGNWYTWSRGKAYADAARAAGMTVFSFAWIDNSASGAEQAQLAWRQYQAIGAVGHQCDCEDTSRPATWQIWLDYCTWWQRQLGRPIITYTGDWWWPAHMGGRGAEVVKCLWAAPNDGYLPSYPGDNSPSWRAGYGGWGDYAFLQYAVSPIANAGGGNLSKTAIRDPAVWAALTGGQMELTDQVPATGQNVGTVLSDVWNLILRGHSGFVATDLHFLGSLGGKVDKLVVAAAADETRDAAAIAAIQALTDLVKAGGGNVDTAAVLTAIRSAAADAAATAQRLQADLDAAAQREADLRAKLAEALREGVAGA